MFEFLNDLPTLVVLMGIALIAIEILVLGFSTMFLLFVGLACICSAGFMMLGLIPETPLMALVAVAVLSVMWTLLLWKPLRKLQSSQQSLDEQPNAIDGLTFRLISEISPTHHAIHRYSGVSWEVMLADGYNDPLPEGTLVKVVKTEVGRMFVTAAEVAS